MFGFHDHSDRRALQLLFDEVGNGLRHSFLNLRSARHFFDHASQLAETGDSAVGNIGHMSDASERKQVVFAHAGEFDVANEDDFVITFFEGHVEVSPGIEMQTTEHFGVHFRYASRCFQQSVTIRIFSDGPKNCSHGPFDGVEINFWRLDCCRLCGRCWVDVNAFVVDFGITRDSRGESDGHEFLSLQVPAPNMSRRVSLIEVNLSGQKNGRPKKSGRPKSH